MSDSKTISLDISGLLGVAFIVLKLCGVIGWSSWWVTAPFWLPLVTFVGIAAVVLLALLVVEHHGQ